MPIILNEKHFIFFYRWLLLGCIWFALVGLIVAYFGDSIIFQFYNEKMALRFWQTTEIPISVQEFKAFIFGPLGGTIAGKYIVMAYLVYYPLKKKEIWAWNAIVVGHLVWFIIDTSISIYYQAYFNIWLINIIPIITLGVPLTLIRKCLK